jgi:hypothetical protein
LTYFFLQSFFEFLLKRKKKKDMKLSLKGIQSQSPPGHAENGVKPISSLTPTPQ